MMDQELQEITFNTGRKYSEKGQIVLAKLVDNDGLMKRVHFSDQTRRIDGEISVIALTQEDVMREYDAGNYKEL